MTVWRGWGVLRSPAAGYDVLQKVFISRVHNDEERFVLCMLLHRPSERGINRDSGRTGGKFVAEKGWQLVETYADSAISGTSFTSRPGIQQLLRM